MTARVVASIATGLSDEACLESPISRSGVSDGAEGAGTQAQRTAVTEWVRSAAHDVSLSDEDRSYLMRSGSSAGW